MLRMGIVGCGIMGKLYASLIDQHPHLCLAGVCDHHLLKAQELGRAVSTAAFSDPGVMYRQAELDAVYIATPDFAHYELVAEALAANIHVLVEKPLTMDVTEAHKLVQREQQSRGRVMVRFGNRYNPPYAAIKQTLAGGAYGRILSIKGHLNDTIMVPTQMIRWSHRTTPGWFLLSHILDLGSWLTEAPVRSVYASGSRWKLASLGIDTWDFITVLLKYDNGTVGQFESGWVLPTAMPQVVDMGLEVVCEHGMVRSNTHQQMVTAVHERYSFPPTLMTTVHGRSAGYLVYSLDVFANCLHEQQPFPITLQDGLENVRVLEAVHRSLELGSCVSLG